MTTNVTYRTLNVADAAQIDALATIWNEACGEALAISSKAVRYNVQPVSGGTVVGRLAYQGEQPVGFILASILDHAPHVTSPERGWLDAVAVAPAAQKQGIGAALVTWAEQWLLDHGRKSVTFGASQRPFAPGLPVELNNLDFFTQRGYQTDRTSWDVAANLAMYETPEFLSKGHPELAGMVRPAQKGDEDALLTFLRREFPNRWCFEFEEFIREQPGTPRPRISDYMLLWTDRGVDGFCQLTFEDSRRPLERFFPYALPRPWGQLGSVGVSADARGRGYGLAVVDAGLRRLRDNGVNGCVIDWTSIVDFYGKFGFERYREYYMLRKALG
ncbi:MAG: GNAT family N-acetyltransferase [Caldilineaceae bacterium]